MVFSCTQKIFADSITLNGHGASLIHEPLEIQIILLRRAAESRHRCLISTEKSGAIALISLGNGLLCDWTRQKNYQLIATAKSALLCQLVGLGFELHETRTSIRQALLKIRRTRHKIKNSINSNNLE